ncbi:MAG: riboflavin biosynthesis protein RibF [Bacteroidota bacterium]|nr:riboflavin biosynthesis protein RibF [Bacteroidota bacterium]
MQVHRDISNLPFFKNAVITIGTFDGVHTGHLQIIQQIKKEAAHVGGDSVIITFHPHPRIIINASHEKNEGIKLLNTLQEKIELLEQQNIDHVVIVPFTAAFSEQSAEEYITNFLAATFHPHTIIIGYDHRFGKNRQGDYRLLESCQSQYNFRVIEIPEHVLHHITISSTRIRQALEKSDMDTANEYLGYSYFFEGKVVDGDKIGRTLGYPTANIEITDKNKLIPGIGIYAVEVSIANEAKINNASGTSEITNPTSYIKNLQGMMSIGFRPTVGGTKKVIEVNIFDFDQSIYGKTIRVYVKNFLREEIHFESLEALKDQMALDKKESLLLLNKD